MAMSDDELDAQLQTAMEGFRLTVVRLLRGGDVHPQLILVALAKVTGEVGAADALSSGEDVEELLGALAETMRQAGREFQEMLRAEAMPTAGNA
jgi:hypothetical protein